MEWELIIFSMEVISYFKDYYEGDFFNDMKHGMGTYIFDNECNIFNSKQFTMDNFIKK